MEDESMPGFECEHSCEHSNCSVRKKNTCIIECEHMVCSFNIRRSNYENEFV